MEETATTVREVLGIGRVENSKNFFRRVAFRLVFGISSCYRVSSCFVMSSPVVASSFGELFRFDSLFFSTTIPQRDPGAIRWDRRQRSLVKMARDKRLPALSDGTTAVPDKNGR